MLPNIEFRLSTFVGDASVNFHVLFSNDTSIEDITDHFLHDLYFVYQGAPQSSDYKKKLKISNLEEFGRRLKQEHPDFHHLSDIHVGMMNAVVDDGHISTLLSDDPSRFKNKYLLGVVADEDLSEIDWNSRDHNARKILIQKSDFLLSSSPKTRNWALGNPPYLEGRDKFIEEFRSLKPCIHGSDAHSFSEIGHPCSKRGDSSHNCSNDSDNCSLRYHWIKSDPTFEGLRQIIYEPEHRSIIQEDNPAEAETFSKISSLKLDLPDPLYVFSENEEKSEFCIKGNYNLYFSNNLTCIIGGRGSGKSTILHLLYNSQLDSDRYRLIELESPLSQLDLSKDTFQSLSKFTTVDIPSRSEFFFQNEIEKLAKDIHSMSRLILDRLYTLSTLDSGLSLKSLEDQFSVARSHVSSIINSYDSYILIDKEIKFHKGEISTLKKQTETIQSDEYKKYQSDISSFSAKMISFSTFTSETNDLKQKLKDIITHIGGFNWGENDSLQLIDSVKILLTKMIEDLQRNYEIQKSNYDNNKFEEKLNRIKQEFKVYLESKSIAPENIQEISDANQEINRIDQILKDTVQKQAPHKSMYDNRDKYLQSYASKHSEFEKRLIKVANILQDRLTKWTLTGKPVTFEVLIDEAGIKSKIINFLKQDILSGDSIRSDFLENILFGENKLLDLVKDKNKILKQVNSYSGKSIFRGLVRKIASDDELLEKIYLRLFKETYDIKNLKIQAKLGDKPLRKTSFGERCGIVVTLILVAGTNPILIDQPEDHLEGRFIAEVLVPLIRNQKRNRQIILITRDANIVIGGDAELIQILETDDNRTIIKPSAIEHIDSRDKYIWILDGGKRAFRAREQKYSLPKTGFQPIA